MNSLAILLFAAQSLVWTVSPPDPTVGDTVRITRRIPAEPGVRPIALPLASTDAYVPLSAPIVAYSEGAVVVRYQVAFFETGIHPVLMPDLELGTADGRSEVYRGDTAWVDVVSVLPTENLRPTPRPSLGPIARAQRTLTPALILVTSVFLGLVIWAVWRRRTLQRPVWTSAVADPITIPLQQWIMAGESKAAVGVTADRLRDAIEQHLPNAGRQLSTRELLEAVKESRPDWPTRDIEEVLYSLGRAQYAPAIPSDIALLVDQVENLIEAIREPTEEAVDQ